MTSELDRYQFLNTIGKGGQGAVYHCRDKIDGRDCCLKHVVLSVSRELKDHMLELDILGIFREHPYVITMDRYFVIESNLYIVMEYSPYGDLLHVLSKLKNNGKSLSLKNVLRWLVQISLALHTFHNTGYVHRDIKPRNILLMEGNIVKLADFGASIPMSSKSDRLDFVGTHRYMSPEMFRGEKHNFATDIWSLGVVLLEMISQRHVFDGSNNEDIKENVVQGRFMSTDELQKTFNGTYTQEYSD
ncbi:hypothetical protein SAMD00019534_125920, partial [Acytostelium subglobosum LB1]|uniref:hypothetical protein n=1 Tax=Acytostelium subglobosum LB1 TaxID=1410327 RepID=UPI000644DD4F